MIVDFHTHTFPSGKSAEIVEKLSCTGHIQYFTDGSAEALSGSMKESGIGLSVNLPVMTRTDQVIKVNDSLIRRQEEFAGLGVITFCGLHPEFDGYKAEIKRAAQHGIKGIKLHPAFQGHEVNDILFKRQIGAISDAGLICVLHSGYDISFMDHNYASVAQLLDVINDVRPQKLVLAHMGGWQAWDVIESDLAGAPVWIDTSYSIGKLYPRRREAGYLPFRENMDETAFIRLARKHGTDKVLFATDSPWSSQKEYIEFMKTADLTAEEKNRILSENALKLLNMV